MWNTRFAVCFSVFRKPRFLPPSAGAAGGDGTGSCKSPGLGGAAAAGSWPGTCTSRAADLSFGTGALSRLAWPGSGSICGSGTGVVASGAGVLAWPSASSAAAQNSSFKCRCVAAEACTCPAVRRFAATAAPLAYGTQCPGLRMRLRLLGGEAGALAASPPAAASPSALHSRRLYCTPPPTDCHWLSDMLVLECVVPPTDGVSKLAVDSDVAASLGLMTQRSALSSLPVAVDGAAVGNDEESSPEPSRPNAAKLCTALSGSRSACKPTSSTPASGAYLARSLAHTPLTSSSE